MYTITTVINIQAASYFAQHEVKDMQFQLLDSIRAIKPSNYLICSITGNNKNPALDQILGPNSCYAELAQIGGGIVTAGCYEMQCSDSNELSITITPATHKCESVGEMFKHPTFDYLNFACPDPKIACGVKKYVKSFVSNINKKLLNQNKQRNQS